MKQMTTMAFDEFKAVNEAFFKNCTASDMFKIKDSLALNIIFILDKAKKCGVPLPDNFWNDAFEQYKFRNRIISLKWEDSLADDNTVYTVTKINVNGDLVKVSTIYRN